MAVSGLHNTEKERNQAEIRNQECFVVLTFPPSREGCVHPLRQWDRSNGRAPRLVGLGLMEHVIKPDSLNVADGGG